MDFSMNGNTDWPLSLNLKSTQVVMVVVTWLFGTGSCLLGSTGTPITRTPDPNLTPGPQDTPPPPGPFTSPRRDSARVCPPKSCCLFLLFNRFTSPTHASRYV